MKQYDVVIIGGGPAGYSAALYSARGMLSTLVVNRGADGGQMVNARQIDNYPGAGVGMGGWDLGEKMKDQAVQFGAEIKNGTVASVELTGQLKTVTLSDGTEITARVVILAMGAYPRPLGGKGEAEFRGKGVSYCATCDGMFFRKKTVAVVGGGDTAIEDALLLAKTCEKVLDSSAGYFSSSTGGSGVGKKYGKYRIGALRYRRGNLRRAKSNGSEAP